MKLTIDGQVTAWDFDACCTLQDALLDIQKKLIDESRVVAEIKLDETVSDLDMNLTPEQVTVDKIVAISFTTTPYKEALLAYLDSAHEKIGEVRTSLGGIVELIVADQVDAAMNALKDGLDTLIWFFDVLQQATANGALDVADVEVKGKNLFEFISKFNTMLSEFVLAMKNNDMTLINDYLEYELEPALKDLSDALPQMIASVKGE